MANTLEIFVKGKGGDQTKREMKKASDAAQSAGKIFKTLGVALSVGVFAKGIQASIRAYAVQEKAVTKLNSALRIQNDFTEANSKALQNQASALQKVTTFGDEAIISAQALLLSYKLTKEEVKKAIPAILDMAAATGKDLRIATDAVGRAIGGQIPLLKTFGVVVDESAFKAEGMTAVLKALEGQFKGQAKAIAESGIGPMEQFGNLMGDVQEDIGRNVIPVLNAMIKTYLKLSEVLNENMDIIRSTKTLLKDQNITVEEHNKLLKLWEEGDLRGLEAFKLRVEKRLSGNKEIVDSETKVMMTFEDKIKRALELEKKRIEAFKERQEIAQEEVDGLVKEYEFRRELRELDLEEVIAYLEKDLKEVSNSEEKKELLAKKLDEYKRGLRVQEAVEIEAMNNKVTELFVSGTKDWESAWQSFRDFVVDFILRDIANQLVKTIGLGKALKAVLGGVTGGGFIGGIGGLLGFQHGGTVPGPIGKPRAAIVHGGEKWTPPGRAGNEIPSGRIEIHNHFHGLFLEADETKWSRLFREKVYPEMQRYLRKTGESFSGS